MYITARIVKGKKYFFIEKSVRLPDSSVRKLYKFIGRKKPGKFDRKKMEEYFLEKEKRLHADWAAKNLGFDYPLTKEDIAEIEALRVEYRRIKRGIPKANWKDLLDRFTVNFTYESNAIEGNSLTLKDVAIVIFEKQNVPGRTLREVYETRNHRKVIELLFAKRIKISHESIINIHKLLMKDMDEQIGYKKLPNFILGSSLKTSPPEKVYADMSLLIKWYKENEAKMHLLQLASLFHCRFLQIHPFQDGNGRVARILVNAILLNKDYPPLIVRKSQRTQYLNALHAFDNRSKIKIIRFLYDKFKDTFNKFFEVYAKYI